jgi:Fe2+ or Zn2+ uptake regulation protein|tara:strand:+ start:47 stop:394 length:348 start_codon:yes stop_codon:yes gene_type:complete
MTKPKTLLEVFTGRKNKYSNRRTTFDGINFHSVKEENRYRVLKLLVEQGIICDLELQPRYPMVINDIKVTTYVADFRYTQDGKTVVEDTKGFKTREYTLKKKLMLALYGITIKES